MIMIRQPRLCVGLAIGFSSRAWTLALAGFCGLILAVEAVAEEKAAPAGETKTLVLFDGKSLDGWKKADSTRSGEVKVEEGAIILPVGRPMTIIGSTRKDLPKTNYE